MPKRSTNDTKFLDPLTYFTDREEIVRTFKDFLRSASTSPLLLAIMGNSGTGKTFLTSYLIRSVCPKTWDSGRISFAFPEEPDFQSILNALEEVLIGCVPEPSTQDYLLKKVECYNKYGVPINVTINQFVGAKGGSEVSDVNQNVRIEVLNRLRDDLSDALVALSKHRERPLCLFIDGYERLAEINLELVKWLFSKILHRLTKAASYPLRVVTCGWEWPNDVDVEPFYISDTLELRDFNLFQVKSYLKKRRVIVQPANSASPDQEEELISAFYELTQGHPLVLGLAVAYFFKLKRHERDAQSLKADKQLIDYEARVKFLDQRLVTRLKEPYLTLLLWGPILRSFDQAALQTLLSMNTEGEGTASSKLDDKAYERFLLYPFITRKSRSRNDFSFHSLVRRVRLEALRLHPPTKEQLHRKIAEYYMETANAKQELDVVSMGDSFNSDNAEWLLGTSEEKFRALLEWFYHTLQVKNLQSSAFTVWEILTERAINAAYLPRARLLLELTQQLTEEGEPFLSENSDAYYRYSIWYDRFLEKQNARKISSNWEISSTLPLPPTTLGAIDGS